MTSKLFETLKLRSGLKVRNRFFKSAMSETLADKNNINNRFDRRNRKTPC